MNVRLPYIAPLDSAAMAAARQRQSQLTKPAGSLGRLEELSIQLAGIAGTNPPPVSGSPAVAVFAADHGVVASGVTPWPQEVTAQMVANFASGGAAVCVLSRLAGARLVVVDVGVVGAVVDHPNVWVRTVRAGTANLACGPAMTRAQAEQAVGIGIEVARELVAEGADLLATGEMGIGNTTAAAAIIATLTGTPADQCTGRGTGIDDDMLIHKTGIVAVAAARARGRDPLDVLADVGGLEIAALAGFIVGGASLGVPVVVDGVITLAGLLVAEAISPGVAERCIASHRSVEPGATVALAYLGLDPLLNLGLRLGEGSGATLAIPMVQAAAALLANMATFPDAGVSELGEP